MPSISKPVSAKSAPLRALLGAVMCMLLLAVMAAMEISRASAAKEAPLGHVVRIENMKYSPALLTVRVGDRIQFKNDDWVPHTVTAKPAGAFDSGIMKPGESWVFVPKNVGGFGYTCTFHPMMVGAITVEKRP